MIKSSVAIAAAVAAALSGAMATAQGTERSCSHLETPNGPVAYDPFVIFFDSGSAAISSRAAHILDNVGAAYRDLSHCRLNVTAHADRAGPAGYNLALSKLRAEAIVDYLQRRGVRAEARIEYFGETHPLVETEDGVAEPQNRRAEIFISPRDGS